MPEAGEDLQKAMKEANAAFEKVGRAVESAVKEGATELDVAEISKKAGLELDLKVLASLKVDRIVLVHPWIPWYVWYPWRPIWCWWWHRYYPWYRCCPWWWYGCSPKCGC